MLTAFPLPRMIFPSCSHEEPLPLGLEMPLLFIPGLDLHSVYLTELEVEALVAAFPLAKTLSEIKEALLNLQQPSALSNSGNSAVFSSRVLV